jgi:hypothetical protein
MARGPVPGWPVLGSTVDSTVPGGRDLPELGLAATPGHDSLTRGGEKKEGAIGGLFCLILRLGRRRGGDSLAVEPRLGRAVAWAW